MKNSKKKAKSKNKLQFVIQTGNFVIKKYNDNEYSYIRIETAGGAWRMDFREDTFKYSWILMLCSEEKHHGILQAWIVITYHVAMCSPDPEFLDAMIKELSALDKRYQEIYQQPEAVGEEG